jgi:signal transduction histidine kinase
MDVRARSAAATGGRGFGLAIAKHLVDAHDGVLSVTSKPAATRRSPSAAAGACSARPPRLVRGQAGSGLPAQPVSMWPVSK